MVSLSLFRRAALLLITFGLSVVLPAHRALAASFSGTVSNSATGANLEGAVLSLSELPLEVRTDNSGRFSFSDLPPGSYTVRVSYTGLDAVEETVEIAEGQNLIKNYGLTSEVYRLEKYTVAGEREGNAVSITKQRNAANVVNVVSMDTYGNVADGNIGNFMQRLPGVAAIIENGDIIGYGVRGTPSEYNAVNIDGTRASNAYAGFNPQGDRATVVDSIPSEFIKEVELIKALTPDLPADSIGGTTNLITKSALDFKDPVLSYRAGMNLNTYRENGVKWTPTAALSYMTRFGAQKNLGVALSSSYTETTNTRDRVQGIRNFADGRNTQARALNDQATRVRAGLGLKVNFKPDENTDLFASMQYTYFTFRQIRTDWSINSSSTNVADYGVVSRAAIEAGAAPRTTANAVAGVAPGFTDGYTELLNAVFQNVDGGTYRIGRTHKFDLGGTRKLGHGQLLKAQLSYSPSVYDFDFQFITAQRSGGFGVSIDGAADRERPVFKQTYGPTIGVGSDPTKYTATRSVNKDHSEEEIGSFTLDYEKKFTTNPYGLEFKSGVNLRQQHRIQSIYQPRWNYVGADGVAGSADDNLAQFREGAPGYGLFNGLYPQRDKYSYPLFNQAFLNNPQWFREQGTTGSQGPNFNEITEDVFAGYLMGRMQVRKLQVVGGVRLEQTNVSATGRLTDAKVPGSNLVTRDADYADLFPSMHFKYEPLKGLLLRASYSTGSARPAFAQLYPVTTVTYNSTTGLGQVNQNNPGLGAQFSQNYDLSVEYYFEPVGLLSANYFRKNLTDFIASEVAIIGNGSDNGFDGNYAGFDLITTQNFGSAKIDGFEVNYSQQLRILPKPFDTLSVFANYTKITTSGSYGGNIEELVRFIPETANAGLTWRLFGKLELRAAWNQKSGYLNTYNANPVLRQRVTAVETWDFNAQYQFSRRLTAFVDVVNAFNDWGSWYTGTDQGRIIMAEVYGTRVSVGLSGRF